jgi:hypothetical protein
MSRLCVVISGYIYQYLVSIDNIINNLIIPNNADVYMNIGIYNNIRGKNKDVNTRYDKCLTNEDIFIIKNKFGKYLKKLFIFDIDEKYMEDLKKANVDYKERTNDFDPLSYNAFYCVKKGVCNEKPTNEQYFHVSKCFDLIPENEIYDYCIRIRLDTRINEIFNMDTIKLVSIEKSETPFIKTEFFDLEHLFCAKFNDMKFICKEFSKKIGTYRIKQYIGKNDVTLSPETQFAQFLYENNYIHKNPYIHSIHHIKSDIYEKINSVFCYHIYINNTYKNLTVSNNNIEEIVLKKNVLNFDIVCNNILAAWYGTNSQYIYVTDILQSLLEKNKIIEITNTTFKNDPCIYHLKKLCIIYLNNKCNIKKIYLDEYTSHTVEKIYSLLI